MIKPTALCNNLKKQTDAHYQYILIKQAIIDNDLSVLEEIKNINQYKEALITLDSNIDDNNLLHFAIKQKRVDSNPTEYEFIHYLVKTNFFKNDTNLCYTTLALKRNQEDLALFLYHHGYKIEKSIKEYFNNNYTYYLNTQFFNQIVPKWIQNKEPIHLASLVEKELYDLFLNNIEYFKNQINSLPEKVEGFFNIVKVIDFSEERQCYISKVGSTAQVRSSTSKVKFAFHALQLIDKKLIEEDKIFKVLIVMINQSIPLKGITDYLSVAYDFYPERLEEMIQISTHPTAKSFLEKILLDKKLNSNFSPVKEKIKL
jgi:hypothetical protein